MLFIDCPTLKLWVSVKIYRLATGDDEGLNIIQGKPQPEKTRKVTGTQGRILLTVS